MLAHRQLIGRTIAGLLFIMMAAACNAFGPDLRIAIDNEGSEEVAVTVDSSAPTLRRDGDVKVAARTGAEWSVPLGSTWEVKVDGRHVVGSGDRTDLGSPSPGQRQDLMIRIQVTPDGTVMLVDAH